jgi:hypothetical protein
MKLTTALFALSISGCAADRVSDWLDAMTLEEKVTYLQGAGSE